MSSHWKTNSRTKLTQSSFVEKQLQTHRHDIIIGISWRFLKKSEILLKKSQKIKTPSKGIYLVFNLVKTRVSKGKPNPVLKIPAQLIPDIFQKHDKKLLKIFRISFYFSRVFPRFYGSRSLQIRALFFLDTKLDF